MDQISAAVRWSRTLAAAAAAAAVAAAAPTRLLTLTHPVTLEHHQAGSAPRRAVA